LAKNVKQHRSNMGKTNGHMTYAFLMVTDGQNILSTYDAFT